MKYLLNSLALVLCVLAASLAVAAQTDDFDKNAYSGVWVFDQKASSLGNGLDKLYENQTLEISVTATEFKIVKTQFFENKRAEAVLLLYTDGRGEVTQPFPFQPQQEVRSRTEWKKDYLQRAYTVSYARPGRETIRFGATEKYKLSKDRLTLTITEETAFAENGPAKRVYRKKE